MSSPHSVSSTSSQNFPPSEEIEHETSTIVMSVSRHGQLVETLRLDSFLKLHRWAPTSVLGIRQFEFKILEWEVGGLSKTLDGYVGFSLAEVPQPKSVCIAMSNDSDFPAIIVYNGIYDVFLGGKKVLESQAGLGIGRGVMQIPPRDISVTFQKGFTFWGFEVGAANAMAMVEGSAAGCISMMSVTPDVWEEGAHRIRRMLGKG